MYTPYINTESEVSPFHITIKQRSLLSPHFIDNLQAKLQCTTHVWAVARTHTHVVNALQRT